MALGEKMMYRATYVKKNGSLPLGTEIQFISDKYNAEYFLFKKDIVPSDFQKEIVYMCKKQFGIDVSMDFAFDIGRAFKVECLTLQLKYPPKTQITPLSQSEGVGCLSLIKRLFYGIVKYFILSIVFIIVLLILCVIFFR